MAFIETKDKERILEFLSKNFMSMPNWLRNLLIVALIVGFFYFGYIRKEIVFLQEKQKTEQIFKKIDVLNQKIVKIEEIRIANEDMIYNIEEVRGIVQSLSELHQKETDIILKYCKTILAPEEYRMMENEIDNCNAQYRQEVNEMFVKKSKDHLRPTTEIVE